MAPDTIGMLSLAAVMVLIALRIPIAVSLLSVSLVGIYAIVGEVPALGMLTTVPYSFAASWTLSSVPMFLFMGFVAFHTGLTKGLFESARIWLGRTAGGLAMASVLGAGGFAAVTGSSVACSAAMGRIAVPEMHRAGYHLGFSTGALAAAGTIGALIPPSIVLILFGIQAQVSITELFKGGLVVGLITLAGYAIVILFTAWWSPHKLPRSEAFSMREKVRSLRLAWPTFVLIVVVFGGLFSGLFTATEAGSVGASIAILLGLLQRKLSWIGFRSSVIDTLLASGGLFMIAVAANVFTRLISLTGISRTISAWLASMGADPITVMLAITLIYLILGMFLEPIGAMLLTLPLMLPLVNSIGVDYIWFGVFVAKLLEMGMITPPVGLNVFVMHSVARDLVRLEQVFYGIAAFLVMDVFIVAGMLAWWKYF